jgi:hypothetical protein
MVETWNDTKLKVNTMIDADEAGTIDESLRVVCGHLIATGDAKPDMQLQMTKSLKEVLRGQNGYPWRRGGGGILSATALSVVDSICSEAASSFATAFDECGSGIRALLTPHGKSKKNSYADGADFGQYIAVKIRKTATGLFKDETWDGTMDGLQDAIIADEPEEVDSTEESE